MHQNGRQSHCSSAQWLALYRFCPHSIICSTKNPIATCYYYIIKLWFIHLLFWLRIHTMEIIESITLNELFTAICRRQVDGRNWKWMHGERRTVAPIDERISVSTNTNTYTHRRKNRNENIDRPIDGFRIVYISGISSIRLPASVV